MKRFLIMILYFFSFLSFSENYLEILNNFEREINYQKKVDLYSVEYQYADFFLVKNKFNTKIADELILLLPDVNKLEENKEKISKLSENVIVFLLDKKSEKLKNRSIEELKTIKFDDNIQLLTVHIKKEDEDKLIEFMINNTLYNTKYFQDVFYKEYKNITRYNYMEVLKK